MMKAYGDKLEEEKSDQDTSSIGEEPCQKKKCDNTSDDTSSIGEASDDDEDEEEEEMAESSKSNGGALASLEALERALPIKRGMSNFFDGRLRSFKCLTDILGVTAEDLVKSENPLNKRRKLLNIQKRDFFATPPSPPRPSLPPTTINEGKQQQQPQG